VIGVSLGGMVAQELAVMLIPEQRLLSLYLGVTTRGKKIVGCLSNVGPFE
ncbi:unnamed protein product, partial [Rotaria socialis]